MGSIQQRKGRDGRPSYRAQVRLRGYPAQTASFTKITDAKAWVSRTETALRDGERLPTGEAKRRTVADLIERRLRDVKRDRPHAYAKEKQVLEWWQARIGRYSLANVTSAVIAEKLDELLNENLGTEKDPVYRAPATANRYIAFLSKAFTEAVQEWRWLHEHPIRGRVARKTEPPGRVRYLSDDERKRLLAACSASRMAELHLIVMLALTTGMRRGEIRELRWSDIDVSRRAAVLEKTKNRERRAVPLVPQVFALLAAHGRLRRVDTDLVFPQPRTNRPIDFDHAFIAAVKATGISNFRFHDLRHTAASYLAMSGATTAEIAAVLGHKTLAMVKRYAHLSEQHTGTVVQRMTDKFFGAG
jgi:integrase